MGELLMEVASVLVIGAFLLTLLLGALGRGGWRPQGRLRKLLLAFLLMERFVRVEDYV